MFGELAGAVELSYQLVEVSNSVVMAFHDNGSNMACVALEGGLLFVDASLSTRVAIKGLYDAA